jgi:hypothetical protein
MGIPIIHTNVKYIPKTPQQGTKVCKGMSSRYHLQIHITMPTNPSGILLIGTWVLIQPIGISINPTMPMNYIKVILL